MASTYLSRTQTNGNRRKFTFSAWVKRSEISNGDHVICSFTTSGNNIEIKFKGDDIFNFYNYYNGSANVSFRTNRKFRDISAWYHIVVAVDTEQSSPANRIKIYFNGVQETSFSTEVIPSQNLDLDINTSGKTNSIGAFPTGHSYFNGCLSHIHFIDGTQYAASDFGSTDSTTGEWKINTSPSVTYGTNGFFLLKDDNAVTDRSGQGNNFALTAGTLTKTEDSPSNVFATINPLANRSSSGNVYPSGFANGNNTINFHMSDGGWTKGQVGTLAPYAGKYYWETKIVTTGGDIRLGIAQGSWSGTAYAGSSTTGNSYSYTEDGNKMTNGGSSASYGNSFTTGDIISFALDCNTGTIWCAKNGTWQNSATISEISAGTTTNSMYTGINTDNGLTAHAVMYDGSNTNITLSYNFGNGYFGTTAVSSAGTNASGNGIFEYDVPTGYTALSTKGLNL